MGGGRREGAVGKEMSEVETQISRWGFIHIQRETSFKFKKKN